MFVPSYWHSRASTMARLCQYGGTNFANAMARVVHFLQNVLHFLEQIFPFTLLHPPARTVRLALYAATGQGTCRWYLHKGAIPGDGKGSGHTVWISRRSRRRSPPFGGCCSRFVHVLGYGQGFHNGRAPFR